MDTNHSILRFAKRFFAGTLLSRVSGAMRDVAMAFCFGSAPEIAAFMVAYRLANCFRRLLGEGNVQAGFVAHFEGLPQEERFRFYRDTIFTMLVLSLAVVAGMELAFGTAKNFFAAEWTEIVSLAMWMAPGLVFICLYALNSGLLQTQRIFFTSTVAPVLFNAGWIGAAFLASGLPAIEAARWLSIGIVAAFALQWAATAFRTRRCVAEHLSWREWFRPQLFSSEWRKLVRPLMLGMIGVGAMQINGVFDAIFARIADSSGPAFLWYALRLQQLPLALFGLALSRVLISPLARAWQEGALDQYRDLLHNGLVHAATLMVPCTFALFALGSSGLNLLFGRGGFTSADVIQTVYCLWGYGLGLVPAVFVLLLASGFYAKKDYAAPTAAALGAVAMSVACNALFVFGLHWSAVSIAFATSAASFANAAILARCLQQKCGAVFPPLFWGFFARLVLAGGFAWGCTALAEYWLDAGLTRKFHGQLQTFLILASVYLGSFLAAARATSIWQNLTVFLRSS